VAELDVGPERQPCVWNARVGESQRLMAASDDIPPTRVWVFARLVGCVEGTLELTGGRVILVATEVSTASSRVYRWLQELAGRPQVDGDEVRRDEPVTVLDVAPDDLSVKWPKLGLGANVRLRAHGTKVVAQFYSPKQAGVVMVVGIPEARRAAEPWRARLAAS
jgi:hypothetical protein